MVPITKTEDLLSLDKLGKWEINKETRLIQALIYRYPVCIQEYFYNYLVISH